MGAETKLLVSGVGPCH